MEQAHSESRLGGVLNGLWTWLCGSVVAMPIDMIVVQIAIAVIAGGFGLVTNLAVTYLKEWWRDRREERDRRRRDRDSFE